jgi:hypothetical protein
LASCRHFSLRTGPTSVRLPPYAPELNPEEQGNHWVKREMENALPRSVDELCAQARRGFRHLQPHPDLLRAFFDHAGLSLNGIPRR